MKSRLDTAALVLGSLAMAIATVYAMDGGPSSEPLNGIAWGVVALAFFAFAREWREQRRR